MRVRALFVHDHRFKRRGGTVYAARQYSYQQWARYLAHFDELVVCGRDDGGLASGEEAGMVLSSGPHVTFQLLPNISQVSGFILNAASARRVVEHLVTSCDVVISRLPSRYGLLAGETAARLKKPCAVELVGCAWDALWYHGKSLGKLYAPMMWYRTRKMVRSAPFVLYVTQRFLQRRYPASGVTVAVSDVELTDPGVDRAAIADLRSMRPSRRVGKIILGHIGSLRVRYKGLQTLLEALGRIKNVMPAFELHVLGPGDPKPWQAMADAKGIGNCVRFDGLVPSGLPVFRWLAEVDLYVQPSLQEGLPRSLVEAMSCGCAAVGSTAGGIPELLPMECLHKPGDAKGLADLILHAARDAAWLHRQGERNYRVAQQYRPDILERKRWEFWHAVAELAGQRATAQT